MQMTARRTVEFSTFWKSRIKTTKNLCFYHY